jgi:type 1 fimbria pilin
MIRNLKALGLALFALLALGAVAASTASAQVAEQGELTSDGTVTLTGKTISISEVVH